MLPKFREDKIQNAQAMVEFALVLPILLLLIFGIFAFGHLFFSYSLVVASSREAARFGAAVGLSDNNLPRYRDCNAIRAAGVGVGGMAGVTPTSITVQYDEGVRADGSPVVMHPHDCPINGVGPGYIQLGDRIVVTVSITYQPIVPMINISAFPLVAETRRTIIIGMPVGDITPSAPLCIGTITRILPVSDQIFEEIYVGEPFSAQLEVISDNPSIPAQGTVSLYIDDPTYTTPVCSGPASSVTNCANGPIFWAPAFYDVTVHPILRARYSPGSHVAPASPCFNPSLAEPIVIILKPAHTVTTITEIEIVATDRGDRARVSVSVVPDPNFPGGGIPTGPVDIFDDFGNSCTAMVTEPYSAGYCDLNLAVFGRNRITAIYNPAGNPNNNPNYLSSTAIEFYIYNTPTPLPTPTEITPEITTPMATPVERTETPGPPVLQTAVPTPEETPLN